MSLRLGVNRTQSMLLPERVEDYVTPSNPVRVIDAFVDGLDFLELGFMWRADHLVGAPAYDPKALLKLFIYGFLNRIRSSRDLEKATKRNLEVIWLMGKLQPDHWTINAFRKSNRDHFKAVFRQFNLLCGKLNLFGNELVAIDSTFFKAVNNSARNFTQNKLDTALQEIDKQTQAYLKELETNDQAKVSQSMGEDKNLSAKIQKLAQKRKEIQELLQAAQASATGQVSLTDPDSRCLIKRSDRVVGYQVQIAVEAKSHLIVVNETLLRGGDSDQLVPMSEKVKKELGVQQIAIVADGGYYNVDQLKTCQENGVEVHVPIKPARKSGDGTFPLEAFRHDEQRDILTCPKGKELTRHADTVMGEDIYKVYYNTAGCRGCPVLEQCTKGKYRKIKIHTETQTLQALKQRLADEPDKLKQRGAIVEHPFGSMKFWMGCREVMTRGWRSVCGEINLTCLAYNMRRAMNLVGVEDLIRAIRSLAGKNTDNPGQKTKLGAASASIKAKWLTMTWGADSLIN